MFKHLIFPFPIPPSYMMGDDDDGNLRRPRHRIRLQRFQTNQRKFAEVVLDLLSLSSHTIGAASTVS